MDRMGTLGGGPGSAPGERRMDRCERIVNVSNQETTTSGSLLYAPQDIDRLVDGSILIVRWCPGSLSRNQFAGRRRRRESSSEVRRERVLGRRERESRRWCR